MAFPLVFDAVLNDAVGRAEHVDSDVDSNAVEQVEHVDSDLDCSSLALNVLNVSNCLT